LDLREIETLTDAGSKALGVRVFGKRMSVVGFVTDQVAIGRILDHLGLSAPQQEKPPAIREIVRVAEHGAGWGVPTDWD
jgi:hypothetical protein